MPTIRRAGIRAGIRVVAMGNAGDLTPRGESGQGEGVSQPTALEERVARLERELDALRRQIAGASVVSSGAQGITAEARVAAPPPPPPPIPVVVVMEAAVLPPVQDGPQLRVGEMQGYPAPVAKAAQTASALAGVV